MIIRNANIVTEEGVILRGSLRVEDGVITAVAEGELTEAAVDVQGERGEHEKHGVQVQQREYGKQGEHGYQGVQSKLGEHGYQGVQSNLGEHGNQRVQSNLGKPGHQGVQSNLGDHGNQGEPRKQGEQVIDANGGWVLPGFIDVHVHGGFGADFMDATSEAIGTIARFHASHGTTSLLATTMTAPREELDRVLETADRYRRGPMPFAQVLGVHLEGPFISPRWPGAQNPSHIAPPQRMWLEAWEERFPRLLRIVTLAPEREGALEAIAGLRDRNIVAAAGHTDATYADMQSAVGAGLSHAVHTFNAMRGLHHREPGTVGAVLTDPRISAEVIADGHHVHAAAIRLLTQVKTQRNLLLITDAISAAGLGDGDYKLGGLDVAVRDGVARLREGGSLAGSTLTMIDALRFMVREVGVSVAEASRYASGNPARLLGLEDRLGSIAAGKQADLLLLSPQLELQRIWIRGAEPDFNRSL